MATGTLMDVMTNAETEPKLLTIDEAWAVLRVSRSTLYRLFDDGLESLHVRGRHLVAMDAIDRFLAANIDQVKNAA